MYVCMYVCMYVYIYTHIFIYIYVCIYTYIYIYTHICMSLDIHMYEYFLYSRSQDLRIFFRIFSRTIRNCAGAGCNIKRPQKVPTEC